MTQLCPIHGFARKHCTWRCKPARVQLSRLANDFRQYWFDRRNGVSPMGWGDYRARYGDMA